MAQNVNAVQLVVVLRALVEWASAVNPNVHQWLRQVESVQMNEHWRALDDDSFTALITTAAWYTLKIHGPQRQDYDTRTMSNMKEKHIFQHDITIKQLIKI